MLRLVRHADLARHAPALWRSAASEIPIYQRRFWCSDSSNKGGKWSNNVPRWLNPVSSASQKASGNDPEDPSEKGGNGEQNGVLVPGSPSPANHPQVLAIPVSRRPVFPGMLVPVRITCETLVAEISDRTKRGQPYVGAFLRKPKEEPEDELGPGVALPQEEQPVLASDLYDVGSFASVYQINPQEGGGAQMLLLGHRRLRKTGVVSDSPLEVTVDHLRDHKFDASDEIIAATRNEVLMTIKEMLKMNPMFHEQLQFFHKHVSDFQETAKLSDLGAGLCTSDEAEMQSVLEELDVPARLYKVLELLKKEVDLTKLSQKIGKKVEEKISQDQRRYFLMEQLKHIKKELGLTVEKNDQAELGDKFRDHFAKYQAQAPEEVRQLVEEELTKLQRLDSASSEFNVTRTYLDWLTAIPWGHTSKEVLDVGTAREVLDAHHHGLDDVKDRILEFIAVARLKGSTQGKIICLVGPPGVGKTSIGRSIAEALHRKYFRFSVGGMADVAEIKGHRRTYVGAMPGKLVQCVKATGTVNPLVLIDEIDKLRTGGQGDPASALLELLDPEQNVGFRDHYLDVPLDMSKVLFMCTANVVEHIPAPLLDRMEVVRLSGYTADEKQAIARRHLEPSTREASGLTAAQVVVEDSAVERLVEEYCREAGVRNLKNHFERMFRKVALKLVKAGAPPHPSYAAAEAAEAAAAAGEAVEEAEALEEAEEVGGLRPGLRVASPAKQARGAGAGEPLPAGAEEPDDGIEEASISSQQHPPAAPETAAAEEPEAGGAGMEAVVITGDTLPEYVGLPKFKNARIYDTNPVGVVTGLAWTSMGGSTLEIEAAIVDKAKGSPSLKTTGQLGSVMQESADIAHSYARAYLAEHDPENTVLSTAAMHLHCPAGATPKDGPSAGISIVTALLSLALHRPIKHGLGMTGEVSLTGRVLGIGGVKEKVIAAKRVGLETVIFPEANRSEFEELDAAITSGLEVHFVDSYDQVFQVALARAADAPQDRLAA